MIARQLNIQVYEPNGWDAVPRIAYREALQMHEEEVTLWGNVTDNTLEEAHVTYMSDILTPDSLDKMSDFIV